jgi:hypothetical protein
MSTVPKFCDVRAVRPSSAGIAALQRVLIVLIQVAGAVAIVRSIVMSPEAARRPDLGRCTEPFHTEGIERRCARDGS